EARLQCDGLLGQPARAGGGQRQLPQHADDDQQQGKQSAQQPDHQTRHNCGPIEKCRRKGTSSSLTPQARSSRIGPTGEIQCRPKPVPTLGASPKEFIALPPSTNSASRQRGRNSQAYSALAVNR